MSVFPLKQQVFKPGELTLTGYDRFGNEVWEQGDPIPIGVFSYEIMRSEEPANGETVNRIITEAVLIAAKGTFTPLMQVEIPGYGMWEIDGHPEDINNNPWYSPGLVTYHAKQVEG